MSFPQTSGKIIMDTSHGELEIELWCKEVPKGCKNFIQLCLNGYYDNCKFHRMFPNFMIQGGDPTGTGEGGKSIYDQPFQDEFHSRLTFCTRGILAYSNDGPNTNESQFFITFDSCPWLDKRHTIFGMVVGKTIFNLMAMNGVDTDENDQPVTPIFIKSTQVVIDPFNLTITQNIKPKSPEKEINQIQEKINQKPIQKPKQKQKNINVLSFGDEEDIEEPQQNKIINSHDVLNDPKLKKEYAISQEELEIKKQKKLEEENKILQLKQKITQQQNSNQINKEQNVQQNINRNILMNEKFLDNIPQEDKQLLNYKIKKNAKGEVQYIFNEESDSNSSDSESSEIEDEEQRLQREKQLEEYEKLKADFLQFKENKFGSNNPMIRDRLQHEKMLQSTVEQRRARFIQNMKEQSHNEAFEEKVKKFQERLKDEKIQNDKYHWLNHKLKFHVDSANAYKVVETKQQVSDYHASDIVNEDTYKVKKEKKNIDKLLKLSEL
ncbi:unnamed protein product [Paramecium primaurelia]|uniref:PPIase cyclophilin-type domain-containing protein n=1 Tax=Paramecium primaurelia TaxID=5886 RepID=A0A8S1NE22_PARPR|nr:unnamed protein product [Paramecium primaurelia]